MTTSIKENQLTCQFCNEPIQLENESDEDYEGEIGQTVYAGDESIDICEACFDHYH